MSLHGSESHFREQLRQKLLKPSRHPYYVSAHGSPDTPWEEFEEGVLRVESLYETGDFVEAGVVLETLCEVFFERWYVESVELSDYGDETSTFVEALSALWVKRIEMVSPSERQKQCWKSCLQRWWIQLEDYGQADCLQDALDCLQKA